ncbi:SgrR family transcriptional regulator [Paenibacillus sp. HN-1]|uniref:ABC transporter substrate-binding protein n=1 Tax=Paenibacillus TaxID=44249 RepID=UPI001CA890C0|nr:MULTISPECIES: ABC transporter substrate-binding protein [Paenibacillus]MBY9078966.1 SgrR family transcriptional regulator [Paenibacillus sp. CGMCC 1.18879]MBY9084356.1 SgrR family transcriptional regulator [Paenibacillus sinensis]
MLASLRILELASVYPDYGAKEPFPVTIEALTGIWHCTPRNVKMILRKLSELEWIAWQPGQGRGHSSTLTVLADPQELLAQEARALTQRGEVREALELIERYGLSLRLKNDFLEWLSDGMGINRTLGSETGAELDTLRFPVYRSIQTLDPAAIHFAFDAHVIGQIYDTLVDFDYLSGTVKPAIAHAWEHSIDMTEWVFHLRKGVLFHHGREVAAEDVVYTLNRLRLEPERHAQSWMFQTISQVEALDRKTVRFQLSAPGALFLHFLSAKAASILPFDLSGQEETALFKHPLGTGPFRLVRYDAGICILEANHAYYRGRPHIDRVEILCLSEREDGLLKEPDWSCAKCAKPNTFNGYMVLNAGMDAEWLEVESIFSGCSLLVFNQRKSGPQQSPHFRAAIDRIIDREAMIEELGDNRIHPAYSFHYQVSVETAGTRRRKPPEKSEISTLLARSGYQGETLQFYAYAKQSPEAEWIARQCRSYGVNLEFVHCSPGQMTDPEVMAQRDCQLIEISIRNEICELELYLQKHFFPAFLEGRLAAEARQAATSLMAEPDPGLRRLRLRELEEKLQQNADVLFLIHKKNNTRFHSSIQGISLNECGWIDFRKIWFHSPVAAAAGAGR